MAMKGSGGGGYGSRQHVEKPVRTGTGSHSARPAGVSQFGYSIGDHTTNRPGSSGYTGEKLHGPAERNFQPVPFGNEVALNVKGGGPGKGRDVHPCGGQGMHGSANPGTPRSPSSGRGILTNE